MAPPIEDYFRVLLESATDLISVLDAEGRIRYASPSHRTVLGYAPEELIGRNAFGFVHADDHAALLEKFAGGVLRGERTDTGEFRYRCADGSWRLLAGVGNNLLSDATIAGVVVTSRDVTERRAAQRRLEEAHHTLEQRVRERTAELEAAMARSEAERLERERAHEALRVSEHRYRELIETVQDAVFTVDAMGSFTYISPAITALSGYVPDELVGRDFRSFVHPDDLAEVTASFRRAVEGQLEPSEFRVFEKSGATRWLRTLSRPVRRADGILELRGVATDITARRQAEDLARRLQAELAHVQRVATIGETTAQVAHEINQPLAAIVNFADGLLLRLHTGSVDAEAARFAAHQIAAEGRRAAEVIRRLREFVRKGELQREPSDLNELTREVLALLESDARRQEIALRLDVDEHLASVSLDRIQIQQVVVNLVRNALEAVAATHVGDRSVVVATRAAPHGVELVVRDTGVGLPVGSERQIFDAFFTTKPQGLGIGLTISRSIVEAHGGTLRAEHNPDRGTTFRIALPLVHGD